MKITISRMAPQGPETHSRFVPHLSAALEFAQHVAREQGQPRPGRLYTDQVVAYLIDRGYTITINDGV